MKLLVTLALVLLFTPKTAFASQFGAGLNAGLNLAPIPMGGIDGFYRMDDLHLGISFSQGELDLTSLAEAESSVSSGLTSIDSFKTNAQLISFEARYFLLFGMNVVAGIGTRKLSIDYSISDVTGGNTAGTVEVNSQITKFGFGTMGRFGLIYLGLDLIAVHAPLSSSVSSSVSTTLPASGSELESLNQDMIDAGTNLGESTTIGALILNIGVML